MRALCAIGLHRWRMVQFSFASWVQCERCGARRD